MNFNNNTRRFIQIIDKIPMFEGLKPVQALEILKVCRPKMFSDREIVCQHGSRSSEMYILLSGKLRVTATDGTPLTELSPITIVGEMGLVTGSPRSANVVAIQQTSVFEISKIKFDVLMKKSPDIGFRIYRNIILILSQRLENNNSQLASSNRALAKMKDKVAALPAA
jgi:CRP/FNR family transcriptional regulator, cyclic AMP receptor protein